jgi:FdhE protein
MTRDAWVEAHPYLQPLARFCAHVESAASAIEIAGAAIPSFDEYARDFADGVPLAHSLSAAIDFEPAERAITALVDKLASSTSAERLASSTLGDKHATEARDLAAELRDASPRVVPWLLGDGDLAPCAPGLLKYLGWVATSRYLRPVVAAFESWRDDERWLRGWCPTCGSPPAMAQLIGVDPARQRFLVCGACATRWRYKRMGCPFCESDAQRISVVSVQGEPSLRIDHCPSCSGYVKTYDGQGDEAVMLADWTSLHLDVIAHDRGLRRAAGSLFELEA